MAKDIIMQVLTSAGYEPMYPFNPKLVMTANFLASSTSTQYNVQINGLPVPLTNSYGNSMGIIAFIPTITNVDNITLSVNGDTARPIVFSDGSNVSANNLIAGKYIYVKYYNDKFYLMLDKYQIGLGNVSNVSPENMPVSTAMQNALNNKMNMPIVIPRNSNLNNYTTAGFYFNAQNNDASTMVNLPVKTAFCLLVEKHAGTKQTFTTYENNGIRMWVRNYFNGVWSAWCQVGIVYYGTSNPNNSVGKNGNIYIKYSN